MFHSEESLILMDILNDRQKTVAHFIDLQDIVPLLMQLFLKKIDNILTEFLRE